MKQLSGIFMVILILGLSDCKSGNRTKGAATAEATPGNGEIVFREYEHSFGKVTSGEKVSWTFTFDNKGTSDIVVTAANTTCGCTVPQYDKNPIAPGKSGNIQVVFDTTGKEGMQTKTITVKSNAKTPVVILKITAEVISSDK